MKLVEVAAIIRKLIKVLIGIAVIWIVFLILSPAVGALFRTIFPSEAAPTVAYGRLDRLAFESKNIIGEEQEYTLNTKTGRLPTNLPTKMNVYKYAEPQLSFEAGKQAQEDAALLGFQAGDLITDLKGETYAWRNSEFGGVLEINIANKGLKLKTPLNRLNEFFPAGGLTQADAEVEAIKILTKLGRFEDPLYQNGKAVVTLGRWRGNQVIETISTLEAQIARVDIFREIEGFPILGPDAKKGLLHIALREEQRDNTSLNYPYLEAYFWELEEGTDATYPIITVAQAWEQIQNGKGVVSNVTPESLSPFQDYEAVEVTEIIINNIYLGYYENTKPQAYMQPVYVFEGNYNGIRGDSGTITLYYPAIPAEYVMTQETTNN